MLSVRVSVSVFFHEGASMRVFSGSIRHGVMGAVSQRRCWEMGWEKGRRAVGIDPTCHRPRGWPALFLSARGFGQMVCVCVCMWKCMDSMSVYLP